MDRCDVAIVGAGPYGLSIAAHLKAEGVDFRVFGNPMEFWKKHMPRGMHLKSEGFASSLYDPRATFPLSKYCEEKALPYEDIGSPVPLEVFTAYGLEFQRRFASEINDVKVTKISRAGERFHLNLSNGEAIEARRVVIAVGLAYYSYIPQELTGFSEEFVTHSSRHCEPAQLKGREVAVIGAGASAIDLATLLQQAGASVQVLARGTEIRFQDPPRGKKKSLLSWLSAPVTGIGEGWKLFLCARLPLVFRWMPEQFRVDRVRRILGPAPCWFTKGQVAGKVGFHLGMGIESAAIEKNRVHLQLRDRAGTKIEMTVDHVIAATGYRPDVRRLVFLDQEILADIKCAGSSPALSAYFESTVAGLYFVGVSAANTFGPLLRFAFGAGFAAPRISRYLSRTASRVRATGSREFAESGSDASAPSVPAAR